MCLTVVCGSLNSLIDKGEFWTNIDSFAELGVDDVKIYLDPKCRSSTIFPVFKKNALF